MSSDCPNSPVTQGFRDEPDGQIFSDEPDGWDESDGPDISERSDGSMGPMWAGKAWKAWRSWMLDEFKDILGNYMEAEMKKITNSKFKDLTYIFNVFIK